MTCSPAEVRFEISVDEEDGDSDNPERDSPRSPLTGSQASPRRGQRRKVEFVGMDDLEKNDSKSEVENDLKRLHGSKGLRSNRYASPRMSLLGKPLNYRAHKRDARYRRTQARVYNFLERPKDWRAISYHLLVFLMVFLCLLLSIFSTIRELEEVSSNVLYYLEMIMVVWFSVEFLLRIWSAGCRSRYQQLAGRLQFIRRPLCIVDIIVISASIVILCLGSSGQVFATSALRGLRFFQILRMVRVDRRGGSWKLLGSVVWAHRQELFTTLYIGFLGLIFSSFLVFLAEKEKNPKLFGTYADALWWGVITLCTVGYGDTVPITWAGKLIAAFCAILGISFFALPAGILGSGFALKVQQQQRQKHLIRRRVPAATLIQCLWRCYAADEHSMSLATWKLHTKPRRSPSTTPIRTARGPRPGAAWCRMKEVFKLSFNASSDEEISEAEEERDGKFKHNSSFMSRLSTRRRDRSALGSSPLIPRHLSARRTTSASMDTEKDYESSDAVNRSHMGIAMGDCNPIKLEDSYNGGSHLSLNMGETKENSLQVSNMLKKSGDQFKESEDDIDVVEQVTTLTEQHKKAIRAMRKIRYFVARRKFKEAFRPYDVKDVIEQYSAGHIDMLGRIKNLQCRLDLILGKAGSKKPDVYDSKISLASRVVKVERQVEDIESKLDLLLEMYKEDRKLQFQTLQQLFEQTQSLAEQTSPGQSGTGNVTSDLVSPTESNLTIQSSQRHVSEPPTPVVKNPEKPMHRNLSDLGPRFKKRVTYRCSTSSEPPIERAPSFSDETVPLTPILKKPPRASLECQQTVSSVGLVHGGEGSYGGSQDYLTTDTLSEGMSEMLTDSEANSTLNSPRTQRSLSFNSAEFDQMSDDEFSNAQENSCLIPTSSSLNNTAISSNSVNNAKAASEIAVITNSPNFHMKPESQALLMRPEVLKLRKTTC